MTDKQKLYHWLVVPLVVLIFVIILTIAYRLLELPSSNELVSLAREYYAQYGYWVVLIGALVEGLLFINWYLPGSVVIVLGVIFASQTEDLSVILVVSLIIIGFFITALINYGLGRFGWYYLFVKLGLGPSLNRMKQRVARYGLPVIFSTYFHPNVGALTATSAGILKLSFAKFALYSFLTLLAWNTLWGLIVYLVGPVVLNFLNTGVIIAVVIIWLFFGTFRFIKHRQKRYQGAN